MRRFFGAVGVLALMTGTLLVVGTAPAGRGSFLVVGPGQSIQAAIDAVSPGGTVLVRPGTYAEHLVITKTVNLIGQRAVLVAPSGDAAASPCSDPGPNTDGICVAGDFTSAPDGSITVNSYVQNVRISGMTISGFGGTGIFQIAGSGSSFGGIRALGNGEYGIAAFDSTDTRVVYSVTSGSGEAGIYIGDSPNANATLFANLTTDNLFGIFVRDAEHGHIAANLVRDNLRCVVPADAPGPDGVSLSTRT